jgi:hypothetical protein
MQIHILRINTGLFGCASVPVRFCFVSCSVLSEAGAKKQRSGYEDDTAMVRGRGEEIFDLPLMIEK